MRVGLGRTIGPLLVGEDAPEKTFAIALDRIADPLDLDQIAADAEHDTAGGKLEIHEWGTTEPIENTEGSERENIVSVSSVFSVVNPLMDSFSISSPGPPHRGRSGARGS